MKELTKKQIAALSEEKRSLYFKQLKRVQRNRKILGALIAVVVIAAAFAVLSVTVLFNIKQINVDPTGDYYTKEEIISASGLDLGDNILLTDFDGVAQRICANLPYVSDVTFNKKLFNGAINISVTDGIESMAFKMTDGYAVTDNQCKMLKIIPELPEKSNMTVIVSDNTVKAETGKKVYFEDEAVQSVFDSVYNAIKESGIDKITKIDIADSHNIKLEYDGRFRLLLGADSQLTDKLREAVKVIAQENEADATISGEINLTILKKVYVKPLDSLEPTTVPETTVTTTENYDEDSDEDSDDEYENAEENEDFDEENGENEE